MAISLAVPILAADTGGIHTAFKKKIFLGFPWWPSGKESACQRRRYGFSLWSGKITQASKQLSPTPRALEPQLLKLECPRAHALQEQTPQVDHQFISVDAQIMLLADQGFVLFCFFLFFAIIIPLQITAPSQADSTNFPELSWSYKAFFHLLLCRFLECKNPAWSLYAPKQPKTVI